MTCQYQSPRDKLGFTCSINRYGGRPHAIACQQCIANGENTEEFSRKLAAILERSHPSTARRVSGCCDSALNPPPV
jgi:hypothetical protein